MSLSNLMPEVEKMVEKNEILIAFNVFNEDSIVAVIKAAEEVNRPIAIETNESDLEFFGIDNVVSIATRLASKAKVPVSLHLDHGMSYSIVSKCVRAGFSSVMFDPTDIDEAHKEEEVANMVKFCRATGVTLESMVGHLQLALDEENTDELLTDPDEAKKFVDATDMDLLAVSVGTEHGSYVLGKESKIDMVQLGKIQEKVSIPLVVHGGSGVSDAQLRELRTYHVGKMNIGSAIRVAYKDALMEVYAKNPIADIQEAREYAIDKMYKAALYKLRLLSC
jgi:ketose-bisphosphate aldolase